jgi:hypothetical protein
VFWGAKSKLGKAAGRGVPERTSRPRTKPSADYSPPKHSSMLPDGALAGSVDLRDDCSVTEQGARHRSPFAFDVMTGETALITGGSKGIGRGIATYLGRHGARVILTSRDSSVAEGVARSRIGAPSRGLRNEYGANTGRSAFW